MNGQFTTLFGVISFLPLVISKLFCCFKRKSIPTITLGRHVKIIKQNMVGKLFSNKVC